VADPELPATRPAVQELVPDETYWWCACGRSKTQPFCDGSHAGTEFEPIEFTVEHVKRYALCQCKRTGDSPWCDGTHSSL